MKLFLLAIIGFCKMILSLQYFIVSPSTVQNQSEPPDFQPDEKTEAMYCSLWQTEKVARESQGFGNTNKHRQHTPRIIAVGSSKLLDIIKRTLIDLTSLDSGQSQFKLFNQTICLHPIPEGEPPTSSGRTLRYPPPRHLPGLSHILQQNYFTLIYNFAQLKEFSVLLSQIRDIGEGILHFSYTNSLSAPMTTGKCCREAVQ